MWAWEGIFMLIIIFNLENFKQATVKQSVSI